MPVPLKIKGIGTLRHKSGEFALITIYVSSVNKNGRKVYMSITYKLHLVNRLKVNIPMSNDILYIEAFTINFSISSILLHTCGVRINIST